MPPAPKPAEYAFDDPVKTGPAFVFRGDIPALFQGTKKIDLKPLGLKLLEFFLCEPEVAYDSDFILQNVWADQPVERNNVSQQVAAIRKKVGKWCIRTQDNQFSFGVPVRSPTAGELRLTDWTPQTTEKERPADLSLPPYIGPQPFREDQAHLFYGRDAQRAELLGLFTKQEKRAVLLHSASGAGKSSLIHAAVRGDLQRLGWTVLPVARLGAHLSRLPSTQPREGENLYTASAITSMGYDEGREWATISNWSSFLRTIPAPGGLVLIIDQLEEIIRVTPLGPPRQPLEFFLQLHDAMRDLLHLRILLAFRQEYLSALHRLAGALDPFWTLCRLDPLDRQQATEAIIGPARDAFGVRFDAVVPETMVEELSRRRYRDALGRKYDEPGDSVEPLQLQVVCEALWMRLPKPLPTRVTWREVDESLPDSERAGAAEPRESVKQFVRWVLRDFCGTAVEEVAAVTAFPVELIDLGCRQFMKSDGARLLVYRDAESTGSLPNAIADHLARRHILRLEDRHGAEAYELAHDTLIEPMRVRCDAVTIERLGALWQRVLREAASDVVTQGDGWDEATLVERCYCDLLEEAREGIGTPARVAGRGRLPARVQEFLAAKGLVSITADGCRLPHKELGLALAALRSTANEPELRPLTSLVRRVFVSAIAMGVTVVATMVTRAGFAYKHLTLTQAPDVGSFAGWFHGVVGAFLFAAVVAPAIAGRWYRSRNRTPGAHSWLQWGAGGLLPGLAGGVLVTLALLKAERPATLAAAGWIRGDSLATAFFQTGYGWTMLIFGLAVGFGCGAATCRILGSERWRDFVLRPKPMSKSRTAAAALRVFGFALKGSGLVFVPIAGVALLVHLIVTTVSQSPLEWVRPIGEALSLGLGDVGLVTGLLFGLYLVEKGVDISADE